MRVLLPNRYSSHGAKDQAKAEKATCFLGEGSSKSSTNTYQKICRDYIKNEYSTDDIVFISVEGNRSNRLPLNEHKVLAVINAEAMIICDNTYNRERLYNIGERELYRLLMINKYQVLIENSLYAIYSLNGK